MALIGVVGPQGSGKSLISLFWARTIVNVAKSQGSEVIIYTNMNASGDSVQIIDDLGDIPFDRSPKILILDEAMFSVDSRRAGSESNVVWTRAVAFFRKANFLAVFYNTHVPSMIDNRIREQLSYFIMARKSKEQFEYLMIDMLSQETKPFYLPRSQDLYDYVDFDTYDFPNPIYTDKLMANNSAMFSVKTKSTVRK